MSRTLSKMWAQMHQRHQRDIKWITIIHKPLVDLNSRKSGLWNTQGLIERWERLICRRVIKRGKVERKTNLSQSIHIIYETCWSGHTCLLVELVFIDDVIANSSNRRNYEVNQTLTTQIQTNSLRLRRWHVTLQLDDDLKHMANETTGLNSGMFESGQVCNPTWTRWSWI